MRYINIQVQTFMQNVHLVSIIVWIIDKKNGLVKYLHQTNIQKT